MRTGSRPSRAPAPGGGEAGGAGAREIAGRLWLRAVEPPAALGSPSPAPPLLPAAPRSQACSCPAFGREGISIQIFSTSAPSAVSLSRPFGDPWMESEGPGPRRRGAEGGCQARAPGRGDQRGDCSPCVPGALLSAAFSVSVSSVGHGPRGREGLKGRGKCCRPQAGFSAGFRCRRWKKPVYFLLL